jgi:hypothetical protein
MSTKNRLLYPPHLVRPIPERPIPDTDSIKNKLKNLATNLFPEEDDKNKNSK